MIFFFSLICFIKFFTFLFKLSSSALFCSLLSAFPQLIRSIVQRIDNFIM
nr:MAG TPA: hypothetical protein [Caudoviricetes sp.]